MDFSEKYSPLREPDGRGGGASADDQRQAETQLSRELDKKFQYLNDLDPTDAAWKDFLENVEDTSYLPPGFPGLGPSISEEPYKEWLLTFLGQKLPQFIARKPDIVESIRASYARDRNDMQQQYIEEGGRMLECLKLIGRAFTEWGKAELSVTGKAERLQKGVEAYEHVYKVLKEVYGYDSHRLYMKLFSKLGDQEMTDLYEYGSEAVAGEMRGLMIKHWGDTSRNDIVPLHTWVEELFSPKTPPAANDMSMRRAERTKGFFRDILEKTGRPWREVLESWWRGGKRSAEQTGGRSATMDVLDNISLILEMESVEPGSVKTLSEQYGILEFGRYPLPLLRQQYKERNASTPYGLIIFPRDDHNSGFQQVTNVLNSFHKELKPLGYSVKVIEVGDKIELARRLMELDQRFGERAGKIAFAVIGGHGTQNSIQLGAGDTAGKQYIITPDVWKPRTRRAQSLLRDHAPMVLVSCSTGLGGMGIGKALSTVFRTKVIAPETDTHLTELHPILKPDGSPDLRARYDGNVTTTFVGGMSQP